MTTIIVLLILAAVTVATLTGKDGILTRASQAREQMKISEYKEKIDLIKLEEKMENNGGTVTLNKLKEAYDNESEKSWVGSTEIITDNSVEKINLTTKKEGYIFYITENTTEYKGKGTVTDTSSLSRSGAIELKTMEDTTNGKMVKITNLAEDYYSLVYQINGTADNGWQSIESGNKVEVKHGETLNARLVFGSDYGEIHSMSLAHTTPTLTVAKTSDELNNLTRKTETFEDIFDIQWGSEGTGTITYSVLSGTLEFKNTSLTSSELQNKTDITDLELGTYKVRCEIEIGSNNLSEETDIKIANLKGTAQVTDLNEVSHSAYGIYSEYDLAYFRDLVNGNITGKAAQLNINAKIMNENGINLSNVCSSTVGNWEPIGDYNSTQGLNTDTATIYYNGIFDGNDKNITYLYINSSELYRQGLFSILRDGIIKNVKISGNVTAYQCSAGVVGTNDIGNVINCTNSVYVRGMGGTFFGGISGNNKADATISDCINTGTISGNAKVGGISGMNYGTIYNCRSNASVDGSVQVGGISGLNGENNSLNARIEYCYTGGSVDTDSAVNLDGDNVNPPVGSYTGGICGHNYATIINCINNADIGGTYNVVGGICGRNLGTINYCENIGNVTGNNVVGGIVGNNRGYIQYVYNTTGTISALNGGAAGISYNQNNNSNAYTRNAYNTATISGNITNGTVQTVSTGTTSDLSSETTSTIIGWTQEQINSNIGSVFVKQTNALPIFNIRIPIANITI